MGIGKRDHRVCGFTILELMVAIAIAMVVLGIAVPSLLTWLPTLRLSSAARQVATDLQVARMKAISQNRKFRLNFLTSSSYVFQYDQNNNGTIESTETESGPFSLPDGITVTALGATSEFQPRGTANPAGTITLSNGSGQKLVCVKTVGRVNIEESNCT